MLPAKWNWRKSAVMGWIIGLLAISLGCHHYVCDGCGGCGGSCAGGNVYVVPSDQKSLIQPAPETIRKLPTPAE
jgi:hypothetical protein